MTAAAEEAALELAAAADETAAADDDTAACEDDAAAAADEAAAAEEAAGAEDIAAGADDAAGIDGAAIELAVDDSGKIGRVVSEEVVGSAIVSFGLNPKSGYDGVGKRDGGDLPWRPERRKRF